MLVPLYGFVAGDTLGVLVLADDGDTVAQLAAQLQAAATFRVEPRANARVLLRGAPLDPRATIAAAGIRALDRVDLVDHVEGG
jgi:hypothetical protein